MSNIDFSRIETDDDRAMAEAQYERDAALAYLQATDWYVLRKGETGKDIPKDVLGKRGEARALLSVATPAPNKRKR